MINLDSLTQNNSTVYVILNQLGQLSTDIREKINFIYESRLDFRHFQKFNLLLTNLNRFRLTDNMSNEEYRQNLSNYVNKLQTDLDAIIKHISEDKEHSAYTHKNDTTAKFFEIMSLIAEFKSLRDEDGKNVDLDYCKNLLQKINEIIDDSTNDDNNTNSNLTESQVEILQNSKKAINAYINELETIDSSESSEEFDETTETTESIANKVKV